MSNLPLYVITFLAYSVLAVHFWRAQSSGSIDVLNRGMIGHTVLLPLALHAYLLYSNIFSGGDLNLGLINALSLILWLTMLVYWVARFFYPIASLQTSGQRARQLEHRLSRRRERKREILFFTHRELKRLDRHRGRRRHRRRSAGREHQHRQDSTHRARG